MTWDDPDCGATYNELTDITCHRPAGHNGAHQGETIVTWSDDD